MSEKFERLEKWNVWRVRMSGNGGPRFVVMYQISLFEFVFVGCWLLCMVVSSRHHVVQLFDSSRHHVRIIQTGSFLRGHVVWVRENPCFLCTRWGVFGEKTRVFSNLGFLEKTLVFCFREKTLVFSQKTLVFEKTLVFSRKPGFSQKTQVFSQKTQVFWENQGFLYKCANMLPYRKTEVFGKAVVRVSFNHSWYTGGDDGVYTAANFQDLSDVKFISEISDKSCKIGKTSSTHQDICFFKLNS